MNAIHLTIIPNTTESGIPYQHLHIQIADDVNNIIVPNDLKGLKLPKEIDYSKGVVIEGKAPIWLYGYLVHECHPFSWVGCYDPRLGAVVVATHTRDVNIAQVLKIDLPNTI